MAITASREGTQRQSPGRPSHCGQGSGFELSFCADLQKYVHVVVGASRSLIATFVSSLKLICERRTAHSLFTPAPGSQRGAWHRAGTRECS